MLCALWNRLVHSRSLSRPSRLILRQSTRRRFSRLSLESLEDRLIPSVFLVTNSSDNLMPGSLRYATMQANLPGNDGSIVRITKQVAPIVLTAGELPINASMTIAVATGSVVVDGRCYFKCDRSSLLLHCQIG